MQLAFHMLCDQALNPPFLIGKIIELANFEVANSVIIQVLDSEISPSKYAIKKMHIFGE